MPRRTAEEADRTRESLVRSAWDLFAADGFDNVSAAEIADRASVTRGALYHHFGGKRELFREVAERIFTEQGQRIMAAAEAQDEPLESLIAGCRAFVEHSQRPDYHRIVFLDGPAVLGTEGWRELDDRHTTSTLRTALEELADSGLLGAIDIAALTEALSGAMNQLGSWIADMDESEQMAVTERAIRTIGQMLCFATTK